MPVFQQLQKASILALAEKLVSKRFVKDKNLATVGDGCREICFIMRGEVNILDKSGHVVDKRLAGQYIGDYELLNNVSWANTVTPRQNPIAAVDSEFNSSALVTDWNHSNDIAWYWFVDWMRENSVCTEEDIETIYKAEVKRQEDKQQADSTKSTKLDISDKIHLKIPMAQAKTAVESELKKGGVVVYSLEKETLHAIVGITEDVSATNAHTQAHTHTHTYQSPHALTYCSSLPLFLKRSDIGMLCQSVCQTASTDYRGWAVGAPRCCFRTGRHVSRARLQCRARPRRLERR